MSGASKIRVIHLIHTMAYGGVETAVLNWLRAFDTSKFEVHLVCFANPGNTEKPFVDAAEKLGIPVHKIPWGRHKPLLTSAWALRRLAKQWQADIVHAHGWYADFVVAITGRITRVKTLTTSYVWFDYDWKRNVLQWLDAKVIRTLDCVTAHCESTRDETIKRGFKAQEVPTLICGFETHRVELSEQARQQRRLAMGVQANESVLINVARFYPEKAHIFLLECFAQILQQRPNTWLWLAGVGPLDADIRAAADRLGITDRVRFLGFITNLPEVLALSDIQLHPAHIEGVPLAICEGMAAALPIIASRVGGLPEVLNHGGNGLLMDELNHQDFVTSTLSLLDAPQEARQMGQRARHFIEHDYSLKTAINKVEQLYTRMVASS